MNSTEERALAVELYNRCWDLLDAESRSIDDDVELLTNAFAARLHWLHVGAEEQWTVSDWMVARVASALTMGDLALLFAKRAYESAQFVGAPDWLAASVAEGLARAYAASGDATHRREWVEVATRLVDAIADDEDRALIASQLATVPTN